MQGNNIWCYLVMLPSDIAAESMSALVVTHDETIVLTCLKSSLLV